MFFKSKAQKNKLDRTTSEILELQGKKKEMEIEVEQLRLKLANDSERQRQELERAQHKFTLELESQRHALQRQRELFEEDCKRLKETMKEVHDAEILKLKKDSEMQLFELKTLAKLDADQKVAQVKLESEKIISELTAKHSVELADAKALMAKEYYEKMQVALKDLTLNGSEQARFAQELALKMFERGPMPAHHISETRVITSGNDKQ